MKMFAFSLLMGGICGLIPSWYYDMEVGPQGYRDAHVLADASFRGKLALQIALQDNKISRRELQDIREATANDIDMFYGLKGK
jgi:hypothetical protein